jgi:3-deoxy-D-manno-octulosonate 8-phosphate phosphatase (KDO 8-P phosphatase)
MKHILEKAQTIRLLTLDIDGILTDGKLYYGEKGLELKAFHIHDGLGIKLLQQSGVIVAVISGKKDLGTSMRLKELNIEHAYLGHENKLPCYEELKKKLNLSDNEIAYMGDDLPDLPLLRRVALSLSVPHASVIIKECCDYITSTQAGAGAVREVCELIMQAQGTFKTMLQPYLLQ